MKYTEFTERICKEVTEYFLEVGEIKKMSVVKNNGVELDGLSLHEYSAAMAPTIYLNDYYKEYENGKTLDYIIKQVIEAFEHSRNNFDLDVNFLGSFETVKDRLYCKLINTGLNKSLLESIPCRSYLDLSIVYYCIVENEQIGCGQILIRNEQFERWGVSEDKLFDVAIINTFKKFGTQIVKITDLLKEMMVKNNIDEDSNDMDELIDNFDDELGPQMFVLTNNERINGAVCLLNRDFLFDFANQIHNNLYILPSSLHELILVPESKAMDVNEMIEMVKTVNETQVAREEVLSNNVYFLDCFSKEISIAG